MSEILDEENAEVTDSGAGSEDYQKGDGLNQATTLSQMALVSPISGRQFTITRTSQLDEYEQALDHEGVAAANAMLAAAPVGDGYRGNDRMAAKLTMGAANIETFADMQELDASVPSPALMIHHHPPIGIGAASGRVSEESRNVQVRAFLYAASREKDNDFHLIIGLDPSQVPNVCMNMEISGLPDNSNPHYEESGLPDPSDTSYVGTVQKLKEARNSFKEYFGSHVPGLGYDFYNPPIPVLIQGSLFFDMTHSSGQKPGPQKFQPFIRTIWEVHPITKIEFEP